MKIYSTQELKNQFKGLFYKWPDNIHIIGIRAKTEINNEFCDRLYCFHGDDLVVTGVGTTVPGRPYLLKPMNPKGCAVLKEGQYGNCWTPGLHNGYKALIQSAPITVYRDANRDTIIDEKPGTEDTGLFQVDIHHAGQNFVAKFIDNFSAGCQVWQNIADFNQMMNYIEAAGQKWFTYTLLNEF